MKAADLVPLTTVYATKRGGTACNVRKAVVLAGGKWSLDTVRGQGDRHRTITPASASQMASRIAMVGVLVLRARPEVEDAALLAAAEGIQVEDLVEGLDRIQQQVNSSFQITVVPSREIMSTWAQFVIEDAAEREAADQAATKYQQQLAQRAEERAALGALAGSLGIELELPRYNEAVTLPYADMIAVLERLAKAEGPRP